MPPVTPEPRGGGKRDRGVVECRGAQGFDKGARGPDRNLARMGITRLGVHVGATANVWQYILQHYLRGHHDGGWGRGRGR